MFIVGFTIFEQWRHTHNEKQAHEKHIAERRNSRNEAMSTLLKSHNGGKFSNGESENDNPENVGVIVNEKERVPYGSSRGEKVNNSNSE